MDMNFVVLYSETGRRWDGKIVQHMRATVNMKKYLGGGYWEDEKNFVKQIASSLMNKGINEAKETREWFLTWEEWSEVMNAGAEYEKRFNAEKSTVSFEVVLGEAF